MKCAMCEKPSEARVGVPHGWALLQPGDIPVCSIECTEAAFEEFRKEEERAAADWKAGK